MNFGEGDISSYTSHMGLSQQMKDKMNLRQQRQRQIQGPAGYGMGEDGAPNQMQMAQRFAPEMAQQVQQQRMAAPSQQPQYQQQMAIAQQQPGIASQMTPQMYQQAQQRIGQMPNMMHNPYQIQMPQFNNQQFSNPMAQQMSRMIW